MKTQISKLSEDFIKRMAEFSVGYFSSEEFEQLLDTFEKAIAKIYFPSSSESNLIRIIHSVYNRINFLKGCIYYPYYTEVLIAISANSNYLTDIVVRNPEYFSWILDTNILSEKFDEKIFEQELKNTLSNYQTLTSKTNALKSIKRKEMLRIGVKDILGFSNLKETTEELSFLARTLTSKLFNLCYTEILTKNNLQNVNRKYCVVALGKLGGNELNYSSDIDLITFYDKDAALQNGKEYFEILVETIYLFIEKASTITENGYLFRVDFRLRPDGRNSPLCRTMSNYFRYYESRGEDWERQMLLKASFVSGDKKLYDEFINYLTPFIYPTSFQNSPLEQIKKIRTSILNHLHDDQNIKLSLGGIRDIEFSLQALQLLNGGTKKNVRTGNSLEAIKKLKKVKLLEDNEANILTEAYIFFRRIEHYLQLMNDAQTHSIPTGGEVLHKLSSFLGFDNPDKFLDKVNNYKNSIAKIYNSIIGIKTLSTESAIKSVRFSDSGKALKNFTYLKEGKGLLEQKEFDFQTVDSFIKIEDELIALLNKSKNPDLILQNFVRIIRTVKFPSIWYEEFQNPKFFESFLKVCEISQRAIDLFAEDLTLLELFLSRKVFEPVDEENDYKLSTKKILFILSVQFTLKIINFEKISTTFSSLLTKKIQLFSQNYFSGKKNKYSFFIAALGSFAASQMSFASDADLIFVSDNYSLSPDIQKTFIDFFTKLKQELLPVEIDCRLRPEGKSSQIIWDITTYKNYLENRARTWEFQSLCRLRFLYGNESSFNNFTDAIEKRISKLEMNSLKKDILDMRKKIDAENISSIQNIFNIKKNKGGLVDIEFITQFLILCNPHCYNQCRGKDIFQIFSTINKHKKELSNDIKTLNENYSFLKTLELVVQNIFNTSTNILPMEAGKLDAVASEMGLNSNEFNSKLKEIIKLNSQLLQKILT